jgi:hypothetical protein
MLTIIDHLACCSIHKRPGATAQIRSLLHKHNPHAITHSVHGSGNACPSCANDHDRLLHSAKFEKFKAWTSPSTTL